MDCKRSEETIYWSHFQTVQFFQILSGSDFDHQLALPEKFAENLRGKLAGTLSLKGPSGAIWNVGLVADGDNLYLKIGWKEFVQDHSLQKNDILVFKFTGNNQLEVSMFDHASFCEKEASYFIKKCTHAEIAAADGNGQTTPQSIRVDPTSSDSPGREEERAIVRKRPRKEVVGKHKMNQSSGKPRKQTADRSGPLSNMVVSPLSLESDRRAGTEEEKDNAIREAVAAASNDSLTMVMRDCHVYTGFYMTFPVDWSRKYLPRANFEACLQVKEKTWMAKCYFRKTTNMHVISGAQWKCFALENFLEVDDVCVFDVVDKSSSRCVFDVRIFRVVERRAVVAATSVKRKGGRPKKLQLQPSASL